jgi:glycosyltransferase involved in cell wall biosynthesis
MLMPIVSVVVPVHNAAPELPDLLAALAGQTAPRECYEVLIVDDASTDGAADAVRAHNIARVLAAPRRAGSYAARNLGIEHAQGRFVAFTDVDCRPAPTWIERGVAAMDAGDCDLLAGRIDMPLGSRPRVAAMLDAARHLDQERYAAQGFAATANMWAPREAFDRFGRFHAALWAGGDAEFGKRAVASGARLRYADDVVVRHPPRTGLRALARKEFRIGHGHGQRMYERDPSTRGDAVWCTDLRMWLPPRDIQGLERLRRRGYEPRGRERHVLLLAQYLAAHLPMMAGNLKSVVDHRGLPGRR